MSTSEGGGWGWVAYIRVGLQSDVWAYNWGWRLINAAAVYGIKADKAHVSVNLLNPNNKTEILIYCPYTFSIEVVGRIY